MYHLKEFLVRIKKYKILDHLEIKANGVRLLPLKMQNS